MFYKVSVILFMLIGSSFANKLQQQFENEDLVSQEYFDEDFENGFYHDPFENSLNSELVYEEDETIDEDSKNEELFEADRFNNDYE